MVKPIQTLALLLGVFITLSIISILLPEEIPFLDNQKLYIPQIARLFISEKDTSQYADISEIRKNFEKSNPKDKKSLLDKEKDSKTDKSKDKIELDDYRKIQYPSSSDTLLYPFLRALRDIDKQKSILRVLHYGDSQLEGDRMTASIRNKFQNEFGGCGVGLIPVINLPNTPSIMQSASNNWMKYTIFGENYKNKNTSMYGLLGAYYQYSDNEASIVYSKSPYANELQKQVQNVKLLYRNPKNRFFVNFDLNNNGQWSLKTSINASTEFNYYQYGLEDDFKSLSIRFEDSRSPEIYGVAFDCNQGIAFDNIPLRGSSGTEFSRINQINLENQIKKMNVKLIILQFGVNIVPYIQEDYDFYEEQFYQELMYLKNMDTDLSILVVGVSDVSQKVKGTYISYPNIEKIRNAQKNAAFRAECAFWDLYESMGGNNSMPSWVFANPALANKDFIHFTAQGADIIAEMLYKAVILEYDDFLLKTSPKN